MATTKMTRGLEVLLVALLSIGAGACKKPSTLSGTSTENRGIFGAESCASSGRVPVPANAALAVYFDKDGQETGTNAEVLTGTSNNTMCPVAEEVTPGACAAGKCQITLPTGKTYCGPC